MRLMSMGNNVQRLDLVTRMCVLYKNPCIYYIYIIIIFIIISFFKLLFHIF